MLSATAQADDGMRLQRFENFEVHTPEQLPAQNILVATARRLKEELIALRAAPLAEPYAGPAVLAGRAAGVFFHEIFGHRLEGHRQKDDLEGQTFSTMIDKRVLPVFLDMVDDPTAMSLGDVPLSGHYHVDDEGVMARRTVLVERGKLKGFLLVALAGAAVQAQQRARSARARQPGDRAAGQPDHHQPQDDPRRSCGRR
jgi:TldD protein